MTIEQADRAALAGPHSLAQVNQQLRRLYQQKAERPPSTVLEAGGGSVSHFVLPAGARLVAIDIDRGQLARNRAADARVQADLHALPIARASIDLVVCFNVIEHLHDPERALRALADCLRPGGLLVLGCPLRASLKGWVTRALPLGLHRAYYRFVVGKRDPGGDGHYDAFRTYFHPVVDRRALPRFADRIGLDVLYARAYDGAAEYEITRGGLARRLFGAPYYAAAYAGSALTLGRWKAAESDLLMILRKRQGESELT